MSLRNGSEALIFNAILKNPKHEEYGETTALFPIPPNEYEPILEQLEVLELGNAALPEYGLLRR